jgi:hypothetical protein
MNYNINNLNGEMLGRACAFAGKGDIRFYLNSIYVEKRPAGGVYIVATNGHYLCVYEDKEALPEDGFKEVILDIYQPNSKKLFPVFTQMKKTYSERVDLVTGEDSNRLHLIRTVDEESVADRINIHEGHYPNWQRVINSEFNLNEPVCFNTQYLAKLKDFVLKKENSYASDKNVRGNTNPNPMMTLVAGSTGGSNIWQSEHGIVIIMPAVVSSAFEVSTLVEPEEIELEEVAQ